MRSGDCGYASERTKTSLLRHEDEGRSNLIYIRAVLSAAQSASLSTQLGGREEALRSGCRKVSRILCYRKKQDAEEKQKYEDTYRYLLVFA